MYWYTNSKSKVSPDSLMAFTGLEEPQPVRAYLRIHNNDTDNGTITYKTNKDCNSIEVRSTVNTIPVNNNHKMNGDSLPNSNNSFEFTHIFDRDSNIDLIGNTIVTGMIDEAMEGYNTALVTYGPKYSGKTYSLYGNDVDDSFGLGQIIFKDLFSRINKSVTDSNAKYTFIVKISFLEVWLDKVVDLLAPQNLTKLPHLKIRHVSEHKGLPVDNLRQVHVASFKETLYYFNQAMSVLNSKHDNSFPRTNTIFNINIEKLDKLDESTTSSSIYLVDLAGSDLIDRKNSSGVNSEDVKRINSSIKSVQNIITSLSKLSYSDYKNYEFSLENSVPYDSSKLGKLLKEPLGGNCKTNFLFTISMNPEQYDDIIEALQLGTILQDSKTVPQINKFGLNENKTLSIALENFKLKENNFKIQQAESVKQIEELKSIITNKEESIVLEELNKLRSENAKLKAQVNTLTQLMVSPKLASPSPMLENNKTVRNNSAERNETSYENVVQTLMEKCEKLADTELSLDDKLKDILVLKRENDQIKSNIASIETLNSHLLDRITNLELQLKQLSTSNTIMEKELDHFSNLSDSQPFKAGTDRSRTELNSKKYSFRRPSVSSSMDSTMEQIEEEQSEEENKEVNKGNSSWFFGVRKTSNKTSRSVSSSSTVVPAISDVHKRAVSMKGLDLHIMKYTSK
ncbi:hypothetical protein TPHA_0N01650 [Tetrapisispora phaffii CBS 4417]|uniref:Kinesin motor domain-containing protein n=1 Tax=Tetrapisispora phaffii (strain ATCC 24235 / CBS 4417 / NBRC 1672 / NRRL Y-8282 / UCD 70-5) TaxID=1071381 RepID=G8C1B8_TETPH|nr:hypothetical protein TPHA_0N01650 [Tetrapisispora phaffii CBS 4417]CCE65946.1 hypothetical protein TPHA_0N01650 [Tetrapisispora phaffii CBS 4417]